ncbi:FAD-binding oxidoreductase [Oricola sp.]|uniref:FAD-binding oxidoreductase n=1 Tax=Oricola sp. TaxID=1979950 RepID=UPI0025D3E47F|nr:FAD-binding oxidoreductase [Oricola sp.]MCI5074134.1 FAD-binding oxidoreductase [Oricola sp.]
MSVETVIEDLSAIVGEANCITEAERLEPYVTEIRGLFRGETAAVVRPGSTEEVAAVVGHCAANGIPMVPQGGNTGQCGGGVPKGGPRTIVISTDRLNRIRRLDEDEHVVVAEAGCILAEIQDAAAKADLLFPLSLASEGSCRIGGNLSTNAGGINVLRYGNARDLVLGLEVVMPDGRIWNGLRPLRKDNTGYALKHLFVGAEGTLGIITAAALKLFPAQHEIATAFVALDDPAAAIRLLRMARRSTDDSATAFELLPRIALDIGFKNLGQATDPFADPHPWYALVEIACHQADARMEAFLEEALENGLARDAVIARSGAQRQGLWRLREVGAGGHQFHEGALVKHDISMPIGAIPEMIERGAREAQKVVAGTRVIAFGHAGDGNLHFNLVQPVSHDAEAFRARTSEFNRVIHDLVHELGGSISAEHGIGMLKIAEMARYKQPLEIDLMRRIKDALDPEGLMNPGKLFASDNSPNGDAH